MLLFVLLFALGIAQEARYLSKEEILRRTVNRDYDRNQWPISKDSTGESVPLEVRVGVHIKNIYSIDIAKMDYTIQINLRQTWTDTRLAYSNFLDPTMIVPPSITTNQENLLFAPDTFFINGKTVHSADRANLLFRFTPNGTVFFSQSFMVTLNCPMDLKRFPFDKQECSMELGSFSRTAADIIYIWESHPLTSSNMMTDGKYLLRSLKTEVSTVLTNSGKYSQLIVRFNFDRILGSQTYELFILSTLIVAISWISFWLNRNTKTTARIVLCMLCLLILIVQIMMNNSQSPDTGYFKIVDVWLGSCLLFVIGTILEFGLVTICGANSTKEEIYASYMQEGLLTRKKKSGCCGRTDCGQKIDNISRVLFPLIFIAFVIIFHFELASKDGK